MDFNSIISGVRIFFEQQSAVANATTIGIPTVTFLAWIIKKHLFPRVSKSPLSMKDWTVDKFGKESLVLNRALRSTLKIAIVDDKPEDIPIDYLRSCGYSVTVFTAISLAQSQQLLDYDLIAMDITNVVTEDLVRGGLELIRRVKANPSPPVVIAVSGKRYDPTVTEFFKLSDAQMKKPILAADLESEIEESLSKRLAPARIAQEMDAIINGEAQSDYERIRIERKIRKALAKSKATSGGLKGNAAKNITTLSEKFVSLSKYYESK